MKSHFKFSTEPLKESTTVEAECGFFVPNAYFPMIWEPGAYPESLSSLLFCKECLEIVKGYKEKHRYMLYGCLERREAKQEEGAA